MGAIQQSGLVTPGHRAVWTTDGVIQDGGAITASQKVLATLRNADFNTTTDQALIITPGVNIFQLTGIIVTNATTSLLTAVGGFYTQAFKAGSAIVAAGQTYSTLVTANLLLQPTLTNFANTARFSSANLPVVVGANGMAGLAIYFSLTTANGNVANADIYAVGIDLT